MTHWKVERRRQPSPSRLPSYQRAALAAWLTDTRLRRRRLAARVIVNRVWQHHFGRGIVATPNDFGDAGEPAVPSRTARLAGLHAIDNGWRLKPIHRLIVTSAVYMQDDRL